MHAWGLSGGHLSHSLLAIDRFRVGHLVLGKGLFGRGRLHGMQEATQEIVRGISSHYEVDGQTMPPGAAKAVEAMNSATDGVSYSKRILRHHAHLWVFADTIGKACWQKGYESGKRKMAPKEDRVLVELSRKDLLHLVCLAHLGFKHMMPNYRGIEMHRFNGRYEAEDGSFAVEKLEVAIRRAPSIRGPARSFQ